ncbi:6-phosphogluconate dehydrogenase [Protomyces lactucae-debilis]|uniref:3-hydroxyisobutyrate dehydrogenase n=1 Tax=Protomyces lactucae-debilis TaxID=2754530 RepID=A0A1Y2FF86_PROLT|nr:6-phosphogluconate dehydrogenase [Protomyces lactucae-debilis]ORY82593.1 6-phosphogluconate dehydrogenase [Protomyces lactucae-debilis]
MLPNSEHVEACFADGLGAANKKDRLFIDCSTIDPFRSGALAKQLADKGMGRFVDAPVSGGVKGASGGTLSFMVGMPSKETDPRVEQVLSKMGASIHYCGKAGAGLSAKLVNNYLLGLNNIATAEAMNMGLKLGLKPSVLGQVINSSTGKCWPSEKNNPVAGIVPGAPAENDFEGGFGIQLMLKDLGLALAAAEGAGVHLGAKDYALDIYQKVATQYPNKDFGVLFKHYEAMSK